MIFDEDLDPKTKKSKPRNLDYMSVPELKDYIEDLKSEIIRAELNMNKKESHKSSAEAFFGEKK